MCYLYIFVYKKRKEISKNVAFFKFLNFQVDFLHIFEVLLFIQLRFPIKGKMPILDHLLYVGGSKCCLLIRTFLVVRNAHN